MKTCSKCGETKSLDQFTKRKQTHDGLHARCQPCSYADRMVRHEREKTARLASYQANRDEKLAKQRAYQQSNREVYRAASKKWREANPLMMRVCKDIWASKNPHKNAAAATRYYARKRKRSPLWLTADHHAEIEKYYAVAAWLSKNSGVKHAVDHIVPLHGENVCGLHVPWNLQVLTLSENSSKGNRHVGDW